MRAELGWQYLKERGQSLRLGEQQILRQIALNQGRQLRLNWEEFCGLYLLLTFFVCALDLPSKDGDKRTLSKAMLSMRILGYLIQPDLTFLNAHQDRTLHFA